MLIVLVLLALAGVGMSIYIAGNGGGSHDVSYLGQHWSGVDAWLPPLAVAGTFGLLALLSIVYGGVRLGYLRRANESLRQEIAHLRELHTVAPAPPAAGTPAPEDETRGHPWWRRIGLDRSRGGDGDGDVTEAAAAGGGRWRLQHASSTPVAGAADQGGSAAADGTDVRPAEGARPR